MQLVTGRDPEDTPEVMEVLAVEPESRATREHEGVSRLTIVYTWTRAYGTSSFEEGAPYGPQLGARVQAAESSGKMI